VARSERAAPPSLPQPNQTHDACSCRDGNRFVASELPWNQHRLASCAGSQKEINSAHDAEWLPGTDIDWIARVRLEAAARDPLTLGNCGTGARTDDFGENSLSVKLLVWINSGGAKLTWTVNVAYKG
jgi:hypothetical protein